jgi:hypothetical protein
VRRFLVFVIIVIGGVIGFPFLVGDGDPCKARAGVAAEHFEGAVETLSEKYPLRIGLVRALFNQHGQADAFMRSVVIEALGYNDEEEGTHPLECVRDYYILLVQEREVEAYIEAELEATLGLHS